MRRIFLLATLLVTLCLSLGHAEYYAVIINGMTPDMVPPEPGSWGEGYRDLSPEFWHDTYLMWEALYTFGWKDENINVLFGDGIDWQMEYYNPRYDSWLNYGISPITDDSCYNHDVVDVFSSLSAIMTNEDILFTFIFDHGFVWDGFSLFYVMDDSIYDTTFARIVDDCLYDERIFCMEQCFAGGFIDRLANDSTFIMIASEGIALPANDWAPDGADTLENEIYNGHCYPHGEFDYHMFNAMRLRTIIGNPLPEPDEDNNGLASMEEVWQWTDSTMNTTPIGQQAADPGDIGDHLYLNIPPYAPTGLVRERVNNLLHLHWNANREYDLDYFRVFRRTYEDSAQQYTDWILLAQTSDTSFTDSSFLPTYQRTDTAWYKIAAVDLAANQSEYSSIVWAPGEIRPQGESAGALLLIEDNFYLSPNHPNPFNQKTSISYALPQAAFVRLSIYDITGREVICLAQGWQTAGSHKTEFDGGEISSGIYLCRLEIANHTSARKIVLLK